MEANEINKLKELWFAGEIELLKVLMEGAGLKYLHLDLYRLLNDKNKSGGYVFWGHRGNINSINNEHDFNLFTESVMLEKLSEKPSDYKLEIDYEGSQYNLNKWGIVYTSLDYVDLFQPPLEIINKIIFELPLDYQPTEIEML